MRVVVAHSPGCNVLGLRRVLLGAGVECAARDCVDWEELAIRLGQKDADLLVIKIDDLEAVNWQAIHEAWRFTSAPKLVIGPAGNDQAVRVAREQGVQEYLDDANLDRDVQLVLQRLCQTGALKQDHGTLIAVLAPTAGSGGTTVASNLAGSLAKNKLWSVGLVDLSHWPGDLALLLNLEPRHTIQDVCQSWQKLDVVGLKSSLVSHATGVNLLSNGLSQTRNESLCPLAIRRILVLSRVTFDFTVLALDHRIGPEELEAMRLSDTVVLVVRPDVPAVRRAKWAKDKAVEGGVSPERLRLVINRWGQRGQLRLDHIETSLKMKAIQLIPDDPARVNTAINEGKLLQELAARATITRRFAALATALNRSVSDNGLGITSSFSRTVRILKNAFRDQNRSDRPRKTRR